jgi:CRP-like cAMP-binding protein
MPQPAMKKLNLDQQHDQVLETLRKINLFKSLSESDLEDIAPHFFECHFDKETTIFHEMDLPSESGRRVYFILEGCVKLVKYSTDGESTIVRLAAGGEFFGVTGALTNKPLPFSAVAFTDTNMITISEQHFREVFAKHPELGMEMIVALGEVLWFNYETHNQVVKKTDARVAKILLYHLNRDGSNPVPEGDQLKLNLPHSYIASMTGIAYEESVRIISRLRKQHRCIIYLRGGKIIITNLDRLKELAEPDEIWGL